MTNIRDLALAHFRAIAEAQLEQSLNQAYTAAEEAAYQSCFRQIESARAEIEAEYSATLKVELVAATEAATWHGERRALKEAGIELPASAAFVAPVAQSPKSAAAALAPKRPTPAPTKSVSVAQIRQAQKAHEVAKSRASSKPTANAQPSAQTTNVVAQPKATARGITAKPQLLRVVYKDARKPVRAHSCAPVLSAPKQERKVGQQKAVGEFQSRTAAKKARKQQLVAKNKAAA